ncbi:MAG: helix-turn-helix domain-containing protein [Armatimonadetes bacterium]|nr:helix-turn-helix domain-containing protein [Armatimonadota bacterium]
MKILTAAEYLDCSTTQVERLIRAGEFSCVQFTVRGDRRIPREELDEFIRRKTLVPVSSPKAG